MSRLKIVIAPDSFKGSLSALEICTITEKALKSVMANLEVVSIPMADGGEGTLDALVNATSGKEVWLDVSGPLLSPVVTHYGVLGDGTTVVIEMAQIAGLPMVPEHLQNPLMTSTFGVGEVFRHALDAGYRNFVVGIGGSATNDGGVGMLQALGGQFLSLTGESVAPVGGALSEIAKVNLTQLDSRLRECKIAIACDVDNPLCGPRGASAVFGPQKGATPDQVQLLDAGLQKYAGLVEAAFGQSFQHQPGAGAAGGLGFALLAIGGAMESGARLVAKVAGLERHLEDADCVITGEGRTDEQTLYGKVPFVVGQMANTAGAKAILLSASLHPSLSTIGPFSNDELMRLSNARERLEELFISLNAIVNRPMTVSEAISEASALLYIAARNIARLLDLRLNGTTQA